MIKTWVFLIAVLVVGSGRAQDTQDSIPPEPEYSLEEIVVLAFRIDESALGLPARVFLIEEDAIRLHGVSELGDLSYLLPASNVASYGYLGGLSTLSLRGARSDQVLFLLDGRPVNDPQSGIFNMATLPPSMVSRVEVVSGGASSLWGPNAVGGVVNLVTKGFDDDRPYSRIAVRNGSYRTALTDLDFGRRLGDRLGMYVSSQLKRSDGFRENSDFEGNNVSGHFTYSFDPKWEVVARFKRYESTLGVPGDTTRFGRSPNARQRDYRLDGDIVLRRSVPGNHAEIQVFGSNIWNHYQNPDIGYSGVNTGRVYGIQVEERLSLLDRHASTVGLYGERIESEIEGDEQKTHLVSGFTHALVRLSPWMNIFAGGRFDHHSKYGSQFSPSVGVALPFGGRYSAYLNWNKSFRAPTLNELYYPGFGNPELEPERSSEVECGLKLETDYVRGSIAVSRRAVKDMIEYAFNPDDWSFLPYNLGRADVSNLEMNLETSAGDWFAGGINLSLSENADEMGERLIYQPVTKMAEYVAVGRTLKEGRIEGRILLSGEHMSERLTETDSELPWQHLFHTKLSCRILDLTFTLRLQNILDTEYELRQGYPMPGRNYLLGAEWEFHD